MSILATELVFQILHYADPRDIVRWRTVSKSFHAITCDPALWKSLYKTSPFPRPPGPFPTEPITSLERTLVKAAQLAQSWTTRPMRAVSTTTIKVGKPRAPPRLIAGRWLVVCESARRFVLHDLDPRADTHTQQVLWELEEPIVSAWDVESVESAEGQRIVYVLLKLSRSPHWKLLEFQLNGDTGELYDSAAVDPPHAGTRLLRVELDAGDSQFIFIPAMPNGLVFDSRTRVFYKLPLIREELDSFAYPNRMIFQDTLFIYLYYRDETSWTIIHVFTLPPDEAPGENGPRVLCLTHGPRRIYGNVMDCKAMKPSIDPATGATNIRFIDDYSDRNELRLTCFDLTLPKHSTVKVLPITVDVHHIDLPRERVRASRYVECCQYIDVSDDGHIRGFYRGKMRQRRKARPWDIIENQHILKFAIDTTQDPWAITRGQIAPAEWSDEDDPAVDDTGRDIVFDGMRGKLCYRHPDVDDQIMVVDIE